MCITTVTTSATTAATTLPLTSEVRNEDLKNTAVAVPTREMERTGGAARPLWVEPCPRRQQVVGVDRHPGPGRTTKRGQTVLVLRVDGSTKAARLVRANQHLNRVLGWDAAGAHERGQALGCLGEQDGRVGVEQSPRHRRSIVANLAHAVKWRLPAGSRKSSGGREERDQMTK